LYEDSKKAIWIELSPSFIETIPDAVCLKTRSADRTDYILHPQTGEMLDKTSLRSLNDLKARKSDPGQVQIIVSDGLNAGAIMDRGHLAPYLSSLQKYLRKNNLKPAPQILVIRGGRVRAGYRIGEILFGELSDPREHRAVIHIIGERPGTIHHTFSAYICAPSAHVWKKAGIDHDITRVVSGIADTALKPDTAARETVSIVQELFRLSS
jgi:ethanolamine ammonia-lyase large subunit